MSTRSVDYQLFFESSPDVVVVLRPDAGRFVMVAATDARLAATHTTREQTMGRCIFELFPDNPDDPAADGARNLRASLERVVATGKADSMAVQKYDIRRPDGSFELRYWSPKNIPISNDLGEVAFIIHRAEDVTEMVRSVEAGEALRGHNVEMEREVLARSRELAAKNLELREANTKLGQLDAAKTDFFSNVSHEFRTPLTLMLGPLEDALADEGRLLRPEQRERIEMAHANALRLLKLVNALLDFSRIEAGRMRARFEPLDLARATAELGGMFQSAVSRSGLELKLECPTLSEPVWVDRQMWEKIVPNLVSNAFKYTHQGEVRVRLREGLDEVVLEVSDTGIGIAEADLPRIFDRFYRATTGAQGRTYEGTGIGLALVHELVELHRGSISVESQVGQGTTFRVRLRKGFAHLAPEQVVHAPTPLGDRRAIDAFAAEAARWSQPSRRGPSVAASPVHPSPPKPARTPGEVAPRGKGAGSTFQSAHVLVVDDNADLREYLSRLLSPTYRVTIAVDGRHGVERARADKPDLVLSDIMMPELDGFGLVRELRSDPELTMVPVILLSARAGDEAAVAGLDGGADDYLVKPFAARELLARVRTHLEIARARSAWAADLERANRELDAFSYSVSHDLRAPLRSIDGFSRALAEDCASALDARGQDYLYRILRGVHRMSSLIDDLLGLARISRTVVNEDVVDLSAMAASIVSELRALRPESKVRVEIERGLLAHGDRNLLRVVLVNLLENAWKFSARKVDATIEVGSIPGPEPTFFVRDNGAGFDVSYVDRLFSPFQRLHSAQDFEGTGIGLATVSRVISRHHGRVWAEGVVGQGATFFFSLPTRASASGNPHLSRARSLEAREAASESRSGH